MTHASAGKGQPVAVRAGPEQRSRAADAAELAVLCVDAVLLAVLELLLLPLYVGAIPFPVTALVAAVTVPLLVRRAGRLYGSLVAGAAPMIVWALAVFVVGLAGPGGDVVMLPDWRTLLLFALGLLPAAVVLGRTTTARGTGRSSG